MIRTLLDPVTQGGDTPEQVARSRAYAEMLMRQSQRPVGHWTQGVANIMNSVLGGYTDFKANEAETTGKKQAMDAVISALTGQPTTQAPTQRAEAPMPKSTGAFDPADTEMQAGLMTPTKYQPEVLSAAQEHKVDPLMLARVLKQESNFNPNAVSPKGASGIAQFMPATAQQRGVNPLDPQSAIPGAAKYLSELTTKFGDPRLGAAAYNWGQGNVARVGGDISRMPAETRNYVERVVPQGASEVTPSQQGAGYNAPDRAALAQVLGNPWTPPGAQQAVLQKLLPKESTWGVIADRDGEKTYGWINPASRSVEAVQGIPVSSQPETVTSPDGKQIPIPPGVDRKAFKKGITDATVDAATGKFTEGQGKALQFANRMDASESVTQKFEAEGTKLGNKTADYLPFGNFAKTSEAKQFDTAKRNFVTALLRKESGALISPDEFNRYDKEFFPQPGDDATVIRQKRDMRKLAIESMKKEAGPAYKNLQKGAPQGVDAKIWDAMTPEEKALWN